MRNNTCKEASDSYPDPVTLGAFVTVSASITAIPHRSKDSRVLSKLRDSLALSADSSAPVPKKLATTPISNVLVIGDMPASLVLPICAGYSLDIEFIRNDTNGVEGLGEF